MQNMWKTLQGKMEQGGMRSGPFLNVRNDEKLLQEAKQAAHGASAGRGTNTHHETPTHSPPLLKSNARTSTFQAWSDEQIREVCRRLERGMRIVVVWRFVPSDDDREPTIHTWLGEISRTGRGTSVEYDGELNADNKYEKWHTHTHRHEHPPQRGYRGKQRTED